ncbi:MAG: T9SS type A sorting domain-containing protein [bacterium]|nr:T9SS type A sorting domain-containing protein [bacterium]
MKSLILLLLIAGLACGVMAQPVDSLWSRLYGGTGADLCKSVDETTDGGFILAGRTNFSPSDVDAWLVKTDVNGNAEWTRMLGGGLTEDANDVVARTGGGYAMAGLTTSYGGGQEDVYFATYTAAGDPQTISYWGGASRDLANALVETSDGGFALGGETSSYGAGGADFWLIKSDAAGEDQWTQTFGGNSTDICYAIEQLADGGYALAGFTMSFGAGEADAWLVRTNSAGQMLWSRTFGWATNDVAYDMIKTSDGGFALAGHTQSGVSDDRDFYLVKTDGNGTLEWLHTYGGVFNDFCYSLQQTSDGGYILAGSSYSFGVGNDDFWLVRLSSTGALLWSRTFGGGNGEYCESVAVTSDGGFILGGQTLSFGAIDWDIWLVRTGPDPALSTEGSSPISAAFSLHPIYPNPFNNTANIRFDLPREVTGRLVVFDMLGREVNEIFSGRLGAGTHSMQFNGANLSSGTYFVQLASPQFSATQKAVLLK